MSDAERWTIVAPLKPRFRDTDAMGHINNAVYVTYLEVARQEYWRAFKHDDNYRVVPFILAHVDIDFLTAYVLASVGGSRIRLSGRYDVFRNVDRDHTAEPDDDDGHAWTAAALWSPARRLRIAVDAARVVASRPAAPVDTGGRRFSGDVRIGF